MRYRYYLQHSTFGEFFKEYKHGNAGKGVLRTLISIVLEHQHADDEDNLLIAGNAKVFSTGVERPIAGMVLFPFGIAYRHSSILIVFLMASMTRKGQACASKGKTCSFQGFR